MMDYVTPLAGVWIEMAGSRQSRRMQESLPLRECGLKLNHRISRYDHAESLPLRECGLK